MPLSIKVAPLVDGIAGRSHDGLTCYIDPSIPLWMHRALRVHEEAEARYMLQGMSYEGAHQKATSYERAFCEAHGLDWLDYDATYKRLLKVIEARNPKPREPDDLFHGADGEKPYTMAPSALDRLNILKVKDDKGHEHATDGKFTGNGAGPGTGKKPKEKDSRKLKQDLKKPIKFSTLKNPKDFIAQRDKLPADLRAFLTLHPPEEYIKMGAKLHLSETKLSGFGLKPDGELISVFSMPGAHEGHRAIEAAIKAGATKLDCLGEPLREIYEGHGFEVKKWMPWEEGHRPNGWDEQKHGKPNVYYMELRKMKKKASDYKKGEGWRPYTPGTVKETGLTPEQLENHRKMVRDMFGDD